MCIRDSPYTVTKDNMNNIYEIQDPVTKRIKGYYNQTSLKKYVEAWITWRAWLLFWKILSDNINFQMIIMNMKMNVNKLLI